MFNKLKDAASGIAEKVSTASSDLKDVGVDKIKQSISDLLSGVEVIRRSGYNPKGINLKLGISPTVTIKVEYIASNSNEDIEIVLNDSPNETVSLFLKALKMIGSTQGALNSIEGIQASDFDVTLGISPSVGLSYKII